MTKVFASGTDGTGATTDVSRIVDEISTMVGTRVIRNEKVADLVKLAALLGLPSGPTHALMLSYADPSRSDVIDETVTAWDTFGLPENSMVYKIKLKSGLTAPQVSMVNVYDSSQMFDEKGGLVRQIVKRGYQSYNLGTVGDITNLPVDLPILAVYLNSTNAVAITHVKVTVNDNQVIHDMDTAQMLEFLKDYNLDGAQFSYPLLFNVEGQISRRLEGIRNMTIRVTSAAPNAIDAWIEQVAPSYI
jgi:hypothetical protein